MTRYCTCPLCEAMCGLAVKIEGPRIVGIRGDTEDPLSAGFLCPKAMALADLAADTERLRKPLIRSDGRVREASWNAALDFAGERLASIARRHGGQSIAFYSGNPNLHSYAAQLLEIEFVKLLRTRNFYSTASVDHLPHLFASYHMFGHQLLLPVPDLDNTRFFLVLGANPAESNGSLMSAPGMPQRLRDIRSSGGKVVVVDPRYTRTAALADRHYFIRPGADALLLLAMIRTLFAEGLVKPGRLASFSDGIEALGAASRPFDPERVAQSCGIPASEISSLAREFAASPAAVCYGRLGACQQEFGATSAWLINALNAITGNLDRAGGSLFPKPAVDIVTVGSLLNQKGSFARWRTRVRGLPEFGGQFPSAALAEEIETPGDGRVRALIVSAGNPALSAPNGARLAKALPRLDFMVAMDFYHNETTAHADVILPPVCALERDHFDVVFRAFGVRNTARYTTPLIDPPPDSLEEWQIYCRLGQRIAAHHGGARGLIDRLRMRVLERITPRRVLSLLLRLGPYGLRLSDLRTEEHTRDLGPLKPCLPRRLATPRKRIQLAPAIFQADITRLAEKLAAPGDPGELVLIGRRQLRSNNSWMHRFSRLEAHDNRCTLLMHPGDAAVRGLRDCDIVEIRGRAGATTVQLEISSSVMPGVVSLPHGFSHASLNDVTDDLRLDNMSGTAAFSGTPVSVAAVNRSSIEDRQFERREHAGIS